MKHRAAFPVQFRILAKMDPQALGGHVPPLELYDLSTDPDEMRDLSADPRARAELTRLHAALLRWTKETHDSSIAPPYLP